MSEPVSAADADAAVRAGLADQAASTLGDPAAAGIYGDPAGAAQPPQAIDLSAAKAVAVDAEALLARIQALEAQQAAAEAAANPPPEPPDNSLHVDSNAPGWLHTLVAKLEERLSAVEAKLEGQSGL